jgi:hypothetical protein
MYLILTKKSIFTKRIKNACEASYSKINKTLYFI